MCINMRFRNPTFVNCRGLWSPEPEERRISSLIKQENEYSIQIDKYREWRHEHQWSASSSVKSEHIPTKRSDADQYFGFCSFRHAANEIERLQKEARELARRKAEEEHAEELQAHDGKSIYFTQTIIIRVFFFLVVKLSNSFQELKKKRIQLETTRETVIRQMQQLHAEIAVRRKDGLMLSAFRF